MLRLGRLMRSFSQSSPLHHITQPARRQVGSAAGSPAPALLVLHPNGGQASLDEALRLGESYSGRLPDHVCIGPSARLRPSPATFFGKGQVEAAAARVAAAQPDAVFVLSGVQQRNLERAFGQPVLDRVALIIEIFSQRARTAEARLQVELASLEYQASRLVRALDAATGRRAAFGLGGDVEVVSARERGRSGSSTGGLGAGGGQGESELQLQRRRVADRRRLLLRRLEEVRRTRAVQRAARRRSGKPQVAIVGYTNAGKSSLLGALSKCGGDVGIEDRLFATLDPTLRRVMLPGGRDVILSDTVGFISDLPTQLIKAFQATLEEVTSADLLLHVLDASSPHVLQQRRAVLQVLRELGISEQQLQENVVEVWNKIDQLPPATSTQQHQQPADEQQGQLAAATNDAAAARPEGQQHAAPPEAGGAGVQHPSAAEQAAEGGEEHSGPPGGLHAAAGAGLLPPAVVALLQSSKAAAVNRPTAVATSVLHHQGLEAVLAAVESKLEALLAREQRSRRGAKRAAAGWQQGGGRGGP